ncbi:pantoate--beta-alanine ligase [Dokdonella soli]|uniref:Pantothenate synthetase n=1 Tax=Dokdonella soli TaxID=529810 RepID=A0ABP3TL35_9GAMM
MRTVTKATELHALVAEFQRGGRRIGLVPTMGNLHAGHYSLIDIARSRADIVVASVFVNPTQFGPNEDFARYPRTPEADAAGLSASGCDVLFLPAVEDMYPYGAERTVRVSVPELPDLLEGAIRPGHFDGVATVVAKLFNLVQPQLAVFGQKDYQQLLVIRRMARDLRLPIDIVGAPIVREANGLAMSSRNQYLDAGQRERASSIHATLQSMREQVLHSAEPLPAIEARARANLEQSGLVPDYAVLRRADDLGEPAAGQRDGLVGLIAARSGSTRLIDNLLIGP